VHPIALELCFGWWGAPSRPRPAAAFTEEGAQPGRRQRREFLVTKPVTNWSEWQDLNLRPLVLNEGQLATRNVNGYERKSVARTYAFSLRRFAR
jgi:hypothetical protein